jgi:hypothetical protein
MDMSRVFVIQNTMKVNPAGVLEPKFDFSPAMQFGELVELLPSTASPFDLPPVITRLHHHLLGFSSKDYLLCVGSPVLIGLAVAIAADYNNGHVAMLQWSGAQRAYFPARAFNVFKE